MSIHNIGFYEELTKIIYHISSNTHPICSSAIKMSRVMRKPAFCLCENKDADQLRANREADQCVCFATLIVQSLYFLNPKFQISRHLL